MNYLRYEYYQETSHSHIGVIPSHWALKRTKYLFDRQNRPPREGDETVTAFRDGQVTLRTNRRTDGFTQSLQEIGYQGVRCGDLVVHAMDGFAGAIGVSDSDGKCTPVYNVCKPVEGATSSKYYGLYLRNLALNGYVESLAKGIRERSTEFRYAELKEVWLPEPPFEEQRHIANFLDHETAKIDILIDKQQQLIKLLKEKRQAVISHAVTKGLNPAAPMKDSGVEWLGEVPEHWGVGSLRWYIDVSSGEYLSNQNFSMAPSESEAIPVIGGNGVMGYTEQPNKIKVLVIGRVGALCGNVHLFEKSVWVTDNALCVEHSEKFYSGFLVLYLRAINLNRLANQNAQPLITGSMVKDQPIVIPPYEEQLEIVREIELHIGKFDELNKKALKAIDLMQERRTALISAAVTGKIDVRNWQPAQTETLREASV